MCFKVFEIKDKIDKLKLSHKSKNWIIAVFICLMPAIWYISNKYRDYVKNENLLNEIPKKLDELKNNDDQTKTFIIEKVTENVDGKFSILIDNIETKNKELLTRSGKAFLDSFLNKKFIIDRLIEQKYGFINGCISMLREYLLFRQFIKIFERAFIKFDAEQVMDFYSSMLKSHNKKFDDNIYSAYFSIYANEKKFWKLDGFNKKDYTNWWLSLEKVIFNESTDSKEFENLIFSLDKKTKKVKK